MPILDANKDWLKADPLKQEGLDTYDPLGRGTERYVATYDKDLGFAMSPHQKERTEEFKKTVDETAGQQRQALLEYKDQYKSSMAAADKQASSALGAAKKALSSAKAPQSNKVRVTTAGQEWVETDNIGSGYYRAVKGKSYWVDKTWLKNLKTKSKGTWTAKAQRGGTYTIDPRERGSQLDSVLKLVQKKTLASEKIANDKYQKAMAAGQGQISDAEKAFGIQRGAAQDLYAGQAKMAEAKIAETEAAWTNFVQERQTAFTQGVKNNTAGMQTMMKSGVFKVKGANPNAITRQGNRPAPTARPADNARPATARTTAGGAGTGTATGGSTA